jgi:hypothetical protein
MNYNTKFDGKLRFAEGLTIEQLDKVRSFLNEDVALQLSKDFEGLEWDKTETIDLVEKVNFIIDEMHKEFPDFGFEGNLLAQGEKIDDRWVLSIDNGRAVKKPIMLEGSEIACPHCGEKIIIQKII